MCIGNYCLSQPYCPHGMKLPLINYTNVSPYCSELHDGDYLPYLLLHIIPYTIVVMVVSFDRLSFKQSTASNVY